MDWAGSLWGVCVLVFVLHYNVMCTQLRSESMYSSRCASWGRVEGGRGFGRVLLCEWLFRCLRVPDKMRGARARSAIYWREVRQAFLWLMFRRRALGHACALVRVCVLRSGCKMAMRNVFSASTRTRSRGFRASERTPLTQYSLVLLFVCLVSVLRRIMC